MRVTVVLELKYGHPDNNPPKERVLQNMAKLLPKAIGSMKDPEAENPIWFKHWDVVSIAVE